MPWVRFDEAYDFKPTASVTIAYPAGYVGLVSRRCADEAVAAGHGVEIERPEAPGARRRSQAAKKVASGA